MAIAQRQKARSFELRAANEHGGALARSGKQDDARELLAPVYSWTPRYEVFHGGEHFAFGKRAGVAGGGVSHGWTIPDAIDVFEFVSPESLIDESQRQSLSR
jgi:hypothetical protein